MDYEFTKAVKEVLRACRTDRKAKLLRRDKEGNTMLWLEAEWTAYDDSHDGVVLSICDADTGKAVYHTFIGETITERNRMKGTEVVLNE